MQKHFNRYYLTEQIGSKPLRSVYLAHHINDVSQKVVLRIFDATCLALNQENERLLSQTKWIKQLKHAHMVPILDLGIEQGHPYVVSEYLAAGSLRYRLDSLFPERLSLQEALSIISQVGQALSYFHKHGHLHENIKPENIFFNEQGEALLADFRLSGFIDGAIIDYRSDPRTVCYMAPELFIGPASEKSDQYALACLAYELITGRMPFAAHGFAMMWASHYAQVPLPLSDLVPDVPILIERALFKAMAKDPSERYADVSAFLLALEGTGPLLAPVVGRSLAMPILDSFSTNVEEPPEDVESGTPIKTSRPDTPIETSLTGAPGEGSLASAPFGMNLAGVPFGASLAGIPFDASLAGVPFGTSLGGNPFEASLAGASLTISSEEDLIEKNVESTPLEASLAGESLATGLEEDSLETTLHGNPFKASLAGNTFELDQEVNPFEASPAGNTFELDQEVNPFEASPADNTFELDQEVNPLGTSLASNSFTARLLERWERARKEPVANKAEATDTPAGKALIDISSVKHFFQYRRFSTPIRRFVQRCKSFIPAFTSALWLAQLRSYLGNLLSIVGAAVCRGIRILCRRLLITRLLEHLERKSSERRANKAAAAAIAAEDIQINASLHSDTQPSDEDSQDEYTDMRILPLNADWYLPFSVGHLFEHYKSSISGLWFKPGSKHLNPGVRLILIFSLLIMLIGGLISYIFLASHSPDVVKHMNGSQKHQIIVNPRNVPINSELVTQPIAHGTVMPTPSSLSQPGQTSLAGNYTEQSQVYNLSTEGRVDWVDWGLTQPTDVNRRSGVQQQISTFSVIGGVYNPDMVQRASYSANARLWWSDGTPVMTAEPQQASGIYVTGTSTGFSLSVPASTVLRTLRVYVGANGAQGKFMASLDGKTYVDESLSTAYSTNGPQANGIYTLTFKGSMPSSILRVTYTAMTTDGNNGYVLLQAATLQ